MRLQTRVSLAVVCSTIIFAVALYAILAWILIGSFDRIERDAVAANTRRALGFIRSEVRALDSITEDWGVWDDTYAFIADLNPAYIQSNLIVDWFKTANIDFIAYTNVSGAIVWEAEYDSAAAKLIPLRDPIRGNLTPHSPLVRCDAVDVSVSGIIADGERPILVASHPIVTSEGKGPIRGAIVMGRFLDAEMLATISERTELPVNIHEQDAIDSTEIARGFLTGDSVIVRALSADSVAGYEIIRDIYGKPVYTLRTVAPRDIAVQGRRCIDVFIIAIAASMLIFGAGIVLILRRAVFQRLVRMGEAATRIGESSQFDLRVPVDREDEFGRLATAMNGMLGSLEVSHKRLGESERNYRRVIDNQGEGVGIVDREERFTFCNPVAESIFGVATGTLVGRSLLDFLPPESANKGISQSGMRREGERTTHEMAIIRPDGIRRVISVTATPESDEAGGYVGAFAIFRDITEMAEAEETIRRQKEEIEEISLPSIRIRDDVLLMPLVGVIDDDRAHRISVRLLASISAHAASVAILDMSGVPSIDTTVMRHVFEAVHAASILGAEVIVTGINPHAAQAIVRLGIDIRPLQTAGSLQRGIARAFAIADGARSADGTRAGSRL